LREIGSGNQAPDYVFARIVQLALDDQGSILVLDGGDKTLKVYDASGQFVRRIGREGSGPGEFMVPTQLELRPNEIRVVDGRQSRFSRFDRNGKHLQTAPLGIPVGMAVSRVHPLRAGTTLLLTLYRASLGSADHDPHIHAVLVRDQDAADRPDTLASFQPGVGIWYTSGTRSMAPWGLVPWPTGDGGTVAVSGDSLVALIDGVKGTVALRSATERGLGPPNLIDLGDRGERFPDRLVEAIRDSIRQARKSSRIELTGPMLQSVITGDAFFDTNGDLWIERPTRARVDREWTRIRVIDGSMTQVRVPARFSMRAVRGDRAYGVWVDDLDVQTVRVYQIGAR
jgi:hypothetical protein